MALLILAGCQTIYESKYEWDAGWRPGTVLPDGHPNSPAYGHLKLPHLN